MFVTFGIQHPLRMCRISGFGGLEVAYWPLVPKFAGSHPAEDVGFFRAKKKILNTPSFERGSKAVGPMS